MAGMLEHPNVESPSPKPMEEAEQAEGQVKSSKKTEDLLEMVKKLQKEGSLEPQIEDLINRINELQQAKKKSSEELGEAHAVWEALHRELDSLNGEKVHLEEVLSKKQGPEDPSAALPREGKWGSEGAHVAGVRGANVCPQFSDRRESPSVGMGVRCQRRAGGANGPGHGPLGILYAAAETGPRDPRPREQQGAAARREEAAAGPAAPGGGASALAARGPGRPSGERRAEGGAGEIRGAGPRPKPQRPRARAGQRGGLFELLHARDEEALQPPGKLALTPP